MVFSSLVFLCAFLPLVLIGYFIMPKKGRNLFLLAASLFFYAWGNSSHVLVLLASIFINYFAGISIQRLEGKGKLRKLALVSGISLNLLLLFYYKYFDFAIENINQLFHLSLSSTNVGLPVGISFFTFQGLSYIIDVYKREVQADKGFLDIALYIAMFPQLVAGPIVKYRDIHEQLKTRKITPEIFCIGIQRFAVGLAKKVLIADVLGQTADKIFNAAGVGMDVPTAWLGIVCYTLQIYFDFSGYSDMAIGLGRMLGFTYKENFDYPYISKSITEFWRRWHISLSTWFKEYLYIPLGGNRRGNVYLHLWIVFLVTGIWHGAAWNFVLWGIWHGIFIVAERVLIKKGLYDRVPALGRWIYTILAVMMGWVLFRSTTLGTAMDYYGYLFGLKETGHLQFTFLYYFNERLVFVLGAAFVGATPILSKLLNRYEKETAAMALRIPAILLLLVLSLIFVVNSTYSPFIYFQF